MDNQQLNTYTINRKPKRGNGFIYKYTSPSGKSYVGQTVQSLRDRAKSNGKGYKKCSLFYKAISKYGFENFTVQILDEVPIQELDNAESYWIQFCNTLRPNGYNLVSDQKSPITKRKIYQYDITTGKFIQGFNSITEAANYLNLKSVARISSCLNKRAKTGNGYIWSFEKKDYIKPQSIPYKNDPKKIHQYSLNGEFIKTYSSISEAAKAVNGTRSSIRKCANGEYNRALGYLWSFDKKDKISSCTMGIQGSKAVKQINPRTKEVIAVYRSQSEAARALGINYSGISRACKDHTKLSAGYYWEYV